MSTNQGNKSIKPVRLCSVEGCNKKHHSKGLCGMHASRLRRTGELTLPRKDLPRQEVFLLTIDKTDTCWIWTHTVNQLGYGKFWNGSREVFAHRYSYELHVEEIPDGFFIDHICHNTLCVNPEHLRLATNKENAEYQKGLSSRNKTGFRGVYQLPSGRYRGQVRDNGKAYNKSFDTAEEAGKWAKELRDKLFTFPEYEGEK